MASSIQKINQAAPNTNLAATTASAATTKSKSTAQASVPQDTVTISAQASANSNSAVSQTASAKPPSVAAAPANGSAAPSATNSVLALQQQVQQLSFQGLSVNQIAANLNVSVSTVRLYLLGRQPAQTHNTAPAPPEKTETNNAVPAATGGTSQNIRLY
jgi:DNA-binding NarL/FixJ family response regulator